MSKRKALHRLIRGFDAYKSLGLPKCVWNLMIDLTREVYGEAGVKIVEKYKYTYDDDGDGKHLYYTLTGWDNPTDPDGEVYPKDIIKKLKELK